LAIIDQKPGRMTTENQFAAVSVPFSKIDWPKIKASGTPKKSAKKIITAP